MCLSSIKKTAKIVLALNFAFIFTNCTTQQTSHYSARISKVQRDVASEDYFSPRDYKDSPYQNLHTVNYQKALPGILRYIQTRPEKTAFQNQETRWIWANERAQKNKNFFSILSIQGEISNQALLANTAFLKKMNETKGNPDYANALWQLKKKDFATKSPSKLFAYQIFSQSPQNKPTILIWAKEHGDELGATEFTTQLTEFFLYHLQGRGDTYVNKVVQDLFNKLNIIIVPDMTPNKNLRTFEDASTALEDFNGYGVLLQPFNYDSNNPDDYVLAPEAAYLKKLILGLDNLVLGIDLHTPFGIGVITAPDDSIAESNRYLIGEAAATSGYVKRFLNRSSEADDSYLHPTGTFKPAHEQISGGTLVSSSYFSRMKMAPSILLELDNGTPDDAQLDTDCKMRHKGNSCTYFIRPNLTRYIPYILRLMEIMAATSKTTSPGSQSLQAFFENKETSKNILTTDSIFFDRLTSLDIKLRMQTPQNINLSDFKNFVAQQSLDWEPQEKERITKILAWIEARVNALNIKLSIPAKVSFIKTTGKEEGNLPYTRNNTIVLPQDTIYSQDLLFTICHELFHLYTKNNPQKRDELYQLIGFKKDPLNLLSGFSDKNKILTNPDVDKIDESISVKYQGQNMEAIPLILSKIEENLVNKNSIFSNSVDFKLLIPDEKLIDPSETDYETVAASNTEINFHPEEILAENFAVLMTVDIKKSKRPVALIKLLNYLKK